MVIISRFRKYKEIILRRVLWLFFPIKITKYNYGVLKLVDLNMSFIPKKIINQESVIYSFGAGEDIHWEVELIRKYGCEIFLFDPTPRSFEHFDKLYRNSILKKNFHSPALKITYDATEEIMEKISFSKIALYNKNTMVKFYKPKNPLDVSHSITNNQDTVSFIDVQAKHLTSIMNSFNHKYIDYLKLDIEGAEYMVVEDIVNNNIDIKVICLEYHYSNDLNAFENVKRLYNSLNTLTSNGFKIIHRQNHKYFTLIKDSDLQKMNNSF